MSALVRPLESTTSAPHFLFSFQLLAARRKSSSAGSGISNPRRVATVGSRQFLANCGAGCGPRSKIFHGQVSNLNQMTLQRTTDPAGRIPQTDWRPQFDQAHPLPPRPQMQLLVASDPPLQQQSKRSRSIGQSFRFRRRQSPRPTFCYLRQVTNLLLLAHLPKQHTKERKSFLFSFQVGTSRLIEPRYRSPRHNRNLTRAERQQKKYRRKWGGEEAGQFPPPPPTAPLRYLLELATHYLLQ